MKQDLIHINEVATILGVTRQAVYKRLTVLGKKATKVGNKAFVDAETIKELKEGKKVSPQVATGDSRGDTATRHVDTDVVNILKQQIEELKHDKVAAQRQVDNLQKQLEIKDRQIEDLSASGREMRLLLGNAQKQIAGLLPSPAEDTQPIDASYSQQTQKQPEIKQTNKKKKKKKKS